jgi:hypothetical protein
VCVSEIFMCSCCFCCVMIPGSHHPPTFLQIGCTMYFVATNHLPFEAATPLYVVPKILEGKYTAIDRKDLSTEVKKLMLNKVCVFFFYLLIFSFLVC